MKKYTYYDLWNFIQKAPIDEFGYCNVDDSIYKLHIYSNKNQVNIVNVLTDVSICNIVFDEDHVEIYKVKRGVCDYNDPVISTDINSSINNVLGIFGYNLYPFIISLLK